LIKVHYPDRLSRFVETDMSFIKITPPKSELAEDKNASNEGDAKLDQPTQLVLSNNMDSILQTTIETQQIPDLKAIDTKWLYKQLIRSGHRKLGNLARKRYLEQLKNATEIEQMLLPYA